MANAELIYEEVKSLPENRAAQVLDFVKYIKQEESRNAESAKVTEDVTNAAPGDDVSWFERGEPCPICAKYRDPVTGEPLFNAETMAAIKEGDAILRGELPAKWYNSLEEMLVDLDKDD